MDAMPCSILEVMSLREQPDFLTKGSHEGSFDPLAVHPPITIVSSIRESGGDNSGVVGCPSSHSSQFCYKDKRRWDQDLI